MNTKHKTQNYNKGFTVVEMLVSITIMLLILIIIASTFILNQRVFRNGNTRSELTQNARITNDLLTREIRQAKEIVTTLPPDNSTPELVAHELQIEDGHNISQIQYIRYYLDGDDLKRQVIVYYFTSSPSIYVHWNDTDPFGPPEQTILEDRLLGEFFSDIEFYGDEEITIDLFLEKNNLPLDMRSMVNPRNS